MRSPSDKRFHFVSEGKRVGTLVGKPSSGKPVPSPNDGTPLSDARSDELSDELSETKWKRLEVVAAWLLYSSGGNESARARGVTDSSTFVRGDESCGGAKSGRCQSHYVSFE